MIKQSTLHFLSNLMANNNKEWFHNHKDEYKSAKENVMEVAVDLVGGIQKFEKRIKPEKPDLKMFRINRDIRFSKDKSPYKENFGIAITYQGIKSSNPGYYLHVEPGDNSAIAGGKHEMDPNTLLKIREFIADNYKNLERILSDKEFKKYFKTFGNEGSAVKTAPRGFDKDHPAIEFIRQKSFTVWSSVSDSKITSKEFIEYAVNGYEQMYRLNQFLQKAVL